MENIQTFRLSTLANKSVFITPTKFGMEFLVGLFLWVDSLKQGLRYLGS